MVEVRGLAMMERNICAGKPLLGGQENKDLVTIRRSQLGDVAWNSVKP